MNDYPVRKTQTKVKHSILSGYLDAWAGIIFWGLRNVWHKKRWRFVYVDCFAFTGKYSRDQESQHNENDSIVYGSPIIGIMALDKLVSHATKQGVSFSINAILIEKDPKNYVLLKQTLSECNLISRVRETANFSELNSGEIALINANSIDLVDDLLNFTNHPSTWAFYLLDPWGASGIPYSFVQKIISQPHHDVMINFIYEDFVRKTGMVFIENLEERHQTLVTLWKEVFGEKYWNEFVVKTLENVKNHRTFRDALDGIPLDDMNQEFLSDAQLIELKERAFIYGYSKVLQSMDQGISIKLTSLKFPDKDRTMLCLYLTTHDPTGALTLNKILYDAQLLEYELRYRVCVQRKSHPKQLTMFDATVGMPESQKIVRPAVEKIGEYLYDIFQGKTLTRKQIFTELVDTHYFPNEVDKALRWLRKNKLADFKGNKMKHRMSISFSPP